METSSRLEPLKASAALFARRGVTVQLVADALAAILPGDAVSVATFEGRPALRYRDIDARAGRAALDVTPLVDAFAEWPVQFDRWEVARSERNRWWAATGVLRSEPLREFWAPWNVGARRRMVLCDGGTPFAYIGVGHVGSKRSTVHQLRAISRLVRDAWLPLRLAAAAAPEDPLAEELGFSHEPIVVLSDVGHTLAISPRARRAIDSSADLERAIGEATRHQSGDFELLFGRHRVIVQRVQRSRRPRYAVARLSLRHALLPPPPHAHACKLTPREEELCAWLALGLTNAQIARRLNVRPSTVKTMLERLYERTGTRGRVALLRVVDRDSD